MRRKHNLRLARFIQCISGVLAILVVYPAIRVIYPCWCRLKGTGDQRESGGTGDHRGTGGTRSSGPSRPHGEPSGKSIPQGK